MKTKRAVPRTRKRTAAAAKAHSAKAPRLPRTKEGARANDPADLQAVLRAFEGLAEGLSFTHDSFAQSLLHLPRPEEFEPLTAPLRQLAAAVPALLDALASGPGPARAADDSAPHLSLARDAVASARARVDRALSALPRAGEYEPVARQLRELATVSPSLMEWLREIPALTAPLTVSIDELREALAELDVAQGALGARGTATEDATMGRVKVVVRG